MARVIVGMLGLGTVGSGVVKLLEKHKMLALKSIAVKDPNKPRSIAPPCPVIATPETLVNDPEIEVLIEVMGGVHPALELVEAAIEKRKYVVTANKELLAKYGPNLFARARKRGVAIFCEASVAGGIPLISTINKGLEANQISSVVGILNGTTNYILSAMEQRAISYDTALDEAQKLGLAEADPSADVEGYDVAYKISILSALAFGSFIKPQDIYRIGIDQLAPEDLNMVKDFGYRLKLLGQAYYSDSGIEARVHPTLLPLNHSLASVSGSNNGILISGDAVGEITLTGPGAGEMPTASAVVGDLINLSGALKLPDFATYFQPPVNQNWASTADHGNWQAPYFLRLIVSDHAGVIGKIGTVFGAHHISIRTIIQKDVEENHASIIIFTHTVSQKNMLEALHELRRCAFMKRIACSIPIFDPGKHHA